MNNPQMPTQQGDIFSVRDSGLLTLLAVVTVLAFLFVVAPGGIAYIVVWKTDRFAQREPEWITELRTNYSFQSTDVPTDVATLAAQVLPALAMAICFRRTGRRRLSWAGWLGIFILSSGSIAAFLGVVHIDPRDPYQLRNYSGGPDGLLQLEGWARASLRQGLTYLLLLLGLQVRVSDK